MAIIDSFKCNEAKAYEGITEPVRGISFANLVDNSIQQSFKFSNDVTSNVSTLTGFPGLEITGVGNSAASNGEIGAVVSPINQLSFLEGDQRDGGKGRFGLGLDAVLTPTRTLSEQGLFDHSAVQAQNFMFRLEDSIPTQDSPWTKFETLTSPLSVYDPTGRLSESRVPDEEVRASNHCEIPDTANRNADIVVQPALEDPIYAMRDVPEDGRGRKVLEPRVKENPDGSTIEFSFQADGKEHPSRIVHSDGTATNYKYDANGKPCDVIEFNADGQQTSHYRTVDGNTWIRQGQEPAQFPAVVRGRLTIDDQGNHSFREPDGSVFLRTADGGVMKTNPKGVVVFEDPVTPAERKPRHSKPGDKPLAPAEQPIKPGRPSDQPVKPGDKGDKPKDKVDDVLNKMSKDDLIELVKRMLKEGERKNDKPQQPAAEDMMQRLVKLLKQIADEQGKGDRPIQPEQPEPPEHRPPSADRSVEQYRAAIKAVDYFNANKERLSKLGQGTPPTQQEMKDLTENLAALKAVGWEDQLKSNGLTPQFLDAAITVFGNGGATAPSDSSAPKSADTPTVPVSPISYSVVYE